MAYDGGGLIVLVRRRLVDELLAALHLLILLDKLLLLASASLSLAMLGVLALFGLAAPVVELLLCLLVLGLLAA